MHKKMRPTKLSLLTIDVQFSSDIQAFLSSFPDGKQSNLVAFHAVIYVTVCEWMIQISFDFLSMKEEY